MTKDEILDTLREKKEKLNEMVGKFHQLKNDGNWAAAWEQLINTLKYANETLKCSADCLNEICGKDILTPEQIEELGKTRERLSNCLNSSLTSDQIDEIDKTKKLSKAVEDSEKLTPKKMIVIPKNPTIN